MKTKKKKNSTKNSSVHIVSESIKAYLAGNTLKLVSFVIMFAIMAILSFFRIATTNTILSFNMRNYEVGQISDITIIATKTLPSDYENPVSVEKGEKVVRKGFPITEEGYAKMKKMSESKAYIDYRAFANSILYLVLWSALYFFLFGKISLNKTCELKEIITIDIFLSITFAVVVLGLKTVWFSSPYSINILLPTVLFTFLVAILFGQLDAVFFSIIEAFVVLGASGFMLVPFLYTLCITFASARIVRRIERRIDLVFASVVQGLLCAAFLLVFRIIFFNTMSSWMFSFLGVSFTGFISGILCLGFITPLEYILNTASVFRLMDLSDTHNPIMQSMMINAGGTYNHSLMVAQLAEAACNRIGANSLLARVGGYYHDIGKIDNPEYFTENQNGQNIHDELNPSLSVSVIRNHVKKGVEKAVELRLPSQIVDIISEHHGNQVLKSFYIKAKGVDPSVKPEDYSYTGNPPTTRVSGVIMLADTVEAACRSLDNPSASRIEKFIQELITKKISENQLQNCPLTFQDLALIKDSFVQILTSFYHSRVKYPDQKDPETGKVVEAVLGDKTLDKVHNEGEESAK
ncbi:MAG: HDIG domain-containing protein [Treponema sp.]|nr:HDIG domain-containing protein [Treponema sp.]